MGLPLRMSNLHAPTVPSGSRSATTANGDGPSGQLTFVRLQQKKDEVEAELKVLGGVLDSVRTLVQPCESHGTDGEKKSMA